jgi:hypothetical protein
MDRKDGTKLANTDEEKNYPGRFMLWSPQQPERKRARERSL